MKRSHALLAALAILAAAGGAFAADDDANVAQARAYFETGSQEYDKGNYLNAIRAFEQAYALTDRPGLLFSLAQAYRRQYAYDSKAQNLRKALQHYQLYIAKDPSGKRRGEAASAINDIQSILARLPPEEQSAPAAQAEPQPTQVSITTQAPEATISIDGGPPHALEPVEVKPGKHRILVRAPGFFPEEREVPALEGRLFALDVPLREMPARVEITGLAGSSVAIDGRPMGALPLRQPLSIDPGLRLITVTRNGYTSFAEEIDLARGESKRLPVTLARTRQRVASYVLFGASVLSGVGGVVSAAIAAGADGTAVQIDRQRRNGWITTAQLDTYNDARLLRQRTQVSATVLLNGAAGLGALAFLLYYFDAPTTPAPRPRSDRVPATPSPVKPTLDISALPLVGPGFLGGSIQATF